MRIIAYTYEADTHCVACTQLRTFGFAVKPLDWITVKDFNGRKSSLGIYGRKDEGKLVVTGNLEHGAQIEPASQLDADKWIAWLQEWKEQGRATKAKDEHGVPLTATDREGNLIHPTFSTDEQLEPQYCGDCLKQIGETPIAQTAIPHSDNL